MDFTGERFVPEVEGDIRLEHMHRYIAARRIVGGKRVLDIACGEGYGSDLLAEVAATVIGVDIDEASVSHAELTYRRSNLRFLSGDIVAIPLDDASVDVVVSFETIEHLVDHRSMMLEIKRVLVPDGVLVLSSPDRHEYSDVPKYKNPFHLRELYQSELIALLQEHFRNHAIYGQRVHYASILAPTAGVPASIVGYRDDADGGVIEGAGLPNPVYFVAVASNGSLPELPAGLFIPRVPPYMRDIAFLSTELELQQRAAAEAERRENSLRIEAEQRASSMRGEMDQLLSQLRQAGVEAEGLRRQVIALELRQVSMQGEMDQRGHRVDELAAELRELKAKAGELRQQVDAILASRSWLAMAPMRSVGLGVRKLKRDGYFKIASLGHSAYRALPIPMTLKMRVKHHLFSQAGSFFANTGAYARWHEVSRQQTATAEIKAARLANAFPAIELKSPARTIVEGLAVADGHWEWQDYDRMRMRIREVLAARRSAQQSRPRAMIKLGQEDIAQAAARISLPSPGHAPEVSVIVPVFNELATTIECLLSLSATNDDVTFEVIIANDASTDGTSELLSLVPNLRLVNQPANLGFLRNCNSAATEARGRRLVLLNNDTQVASDWLTGLMRALDEPNVGAVGPRFVYPGGQLQEAGARIRRNGTVEMIGANESSGSPRWSYTREVDYVSGACLMLDTALFRELGGFADDLAPAYCEDLELCLRIRERGLRVLYTPESEVVHHLSKSSNALGDSYKHDRIARNMQLLSERYQAMFELAR